ncbi:hypothetical protein ABZT06_46720 [Streptomyces sp. NPDC005483]|uniref:hypothetical protein n=1 Tax=Streptomyces sp. NPDC005483 TaxID=3154882 RepID=UPI0033B37229
MNNNKRSATQVANHGPSQGLAGGGGAIGRSSAAADGESAVKNGAASAGREDIHLNGERTEDAAAEQSLPPVQEEQTATASPDGSTASHTVTRDAEATQTRPVDTVTQPNDSVVPRESPAAVDTAQAQPVRGATPTQAATEHTSSATGAEPAAKSVTNSSYRGDTDVRTLQDLAREQQGQPGGGNAQSPAGTQPSVVSARTEHGDTSVPASTAAQGPARRNTGDVRAQGTTERPTAPNSHSATRASEPGSAPAAPGGAHLEADPSLTTAPADGLLSPGRADADSAPVRATEPVPAPGTTPRTDTGPRTGGMTAPDTRSPAGTATQPESITSTRTGTDVAATSHPLSTASEHRWTTAPAAPVERTETVATGSVTEVEPGTQPRDTDAATVPAAQGQGGRPAEPEPHLSDELDPVIEGLSNGSVAWAVKTLKEVGFALGDAWAAGADRAAVPGDEVLVVRAVAESAARGGPVVSVARSALPVAEVAEGDVPVLVERWLGSLQRRVSGGEVVTPRMLAVRDWLVGQSETMSQEQQAVLAVVHESMDELVRVQLAEPVVLPVAETPFRNLAEHLSDELDPVIEGLSNGSVAWAVKTLKEVGFALGDAWAAGADRAAVPGDEVLVVRAVAESAARGGPVVSVARSALPVAEVAEGDVPVLVERWLGSLQRRVSGGEVVTPRMLAVRDWLVGQSETMSQEQQAVLAVVHESMDELVRVQLAEPVVLPVAETRFRNLADARRDDVATAPSTAAQRPDPVPLPTATESVVSPQTDSRQAHLADMEGDTGPAHSTGTPADAISGLVSQGDEAEQPIAAGSHASGQVVQVWSANTNQSHIAGLFRLVEQGIRGSLSPQALSGVMTQLGKYQGEMTPQQRATFSQLSNPSPAAPTHVDGTRTATEAAAREALPPSSRSRNLMGPRPRLIPAPAAPPQAQEPSPAHADEHQPGRQASQHNDRPEPASVKRERRRRQLFNQSPVTGLNQVLDAAPVTDVPEQPLAQRGRVDYGRIGGEFETQWQLSAAETLDHGHRLAGNSLLTLTVERLGTDETPFLEIVGAPIARHGEQNGIGEEPFWESLEEVLRTLQSGKPADRLFGAHNGFESMEYGHAVFVSEDPGTRNWLSPQWTVGMHASELFDFIMEDVLPLSTVQSPLTARVDAQAGAAFAKEIAAHFYADAHGLSAVDPTLAWHTLDDAEYRSLAGVLLLVFTQAITIAHTQDDEAVGQARRWPKSYTLVASRHDPHKLAEALSAQARDYLNVHADQIRQAFVRYAERLLNTRRVQDPLYASVTLGLVSVRNYLDSFLLRDPDRSTSQKALGMMTVFDEFDGRKLLVELRYLPDVRNVSDARQSYETLKRLAYSRHEAAARRGVLGSGHHEEKQRLLEALGQNALVHMLGRLVRSIDALNTVDHQSAHGFRPLDQTDVRILMHRVLDLNGVDVALPDNIALVTSTRQRAQVSDVLLKLGADLTSFAFAFHGADQGRGGWETVGPHWAQAMRDVARLREYLAGERADWPPRSVIDLWGSSYVGSSRPSRDTSGIDEAVRQVLHRPDLTNLREVLHQTSIWRGRNAGVQGTIDSVVEMLERDVLYMLGDSMRVEEAAAGQDRARTGPRAFRPSVGVLNQWADKFAYAREYLDEAEDVDELRAAAAVLLAEYLIELPATDGSHASDAGSEREHYGKVVDVVAFALGQSRHLAHPDRRARGVAQGAAEAFGGTDIVSQRPSNTVTVSGTGRAAVSTSAGLARISSRWQQRNRGMLRLLEQGINGTLSPTAVRSLQEQLEALVPEMTPQQRATFRRLSTPVGAAQADRNGARTVAPPRRPHGPRTHRTASPSETPAAPVGQATGDTATGARSLSRPAATGTRVQGPRPRPDRARSSEANVEQTAAPAVDMSAPSLAGRERRRGGQLSREDAAALSAALNLGDDAPASEPAKPMAEAPTGIRSAEPGQELPHIDYGKIGAEFETDWDLEVPDNYHHGRILADDGRLKLTVERVRPGAAPFLEIVSMPIAYRGEPGGIPEEQFWRSLGDTLETLNRTGGGRLHDLFGPHSGFVVHHADAVLSTDEGRELTLDPQWTVGMHPTELLDFLLDDIRSLYHASSPDDPDQVDLAVGAAFAKDLAANYFAHAHGVLVPNTAIAYHLLDDNDVRSLAGMSMLIFLQAIAAVRGGNDVAAGNKTRRWVKSYLTVASRHSPATLAGALSPAVRDYLEVHAEQVLAKFAEYAHRIQTRDARHFDPLADQLAGASVRQYLENFLLRRPPVHVDQHALTIETTFDELDGGKVLVELRDLPEVRGVGEARDMYLTLKKHAHHRFEIAARRNLTGSASPAVSLYRWVSADTDLAKTVHMLVRRIDFLDGVRRRAGFGEPLWGEEIAGMLRRVLRLASDGNAVGGQIPPYLQDEGERAVAAEVLSVVETRIREFAVQVNVPLNHVAWNETRGPWDQVMADLSWLRETLVAEPGFWPPSAGVLETIATSSHHDLRDAVARVTLAPEDTLALRDVLAQAEEFGEAVGENHPSAVGDLERWALHALTVATRTDGGLSTAASTDAELGSRAQPSVADLRHWTDLFDFARDLLPYLPAADDVWTTARQIVQEHHVSPLAPGEDDSVEAGAYRWLHNRVVDVVVSTLFQYRGSPNALHYATGVAQQMAVAFDSARPAWDGSAPSADAPVQVWQARDTDVTAHGLRSRLRDAIDGPARDTRLIAQLLLAIRRWEGRQEQDLTGDTLQAALDDHYWANDLLLAATVPTADVSVNIVRAAEEEVTRTAAVLVSLGVDPKLLRRRAAPSGVESPETEDGTAPAQQLATVGAMPAAEDRPDTPSEGETAPAAADEPDQAVGAPRVPDTDRAPVTDPDVATRSNPIRYSEAAAPNIAELVGTVWKPQEGTPAEADASRVAQAVVDHIGRTLATAGVDPQSRDIYVDLSSFPGKESDWLTHVFSKVPDMARHSVRVMFSGFDVNLCPDSDLDADFVPMDA